MLWASLLALFEARLTRAGAHVEISPAKNGNAPHGKSWAQPKRLSEKRNHVWRVGWPGKPVKKVMIWQSCMNPESVTGTFAHRNGGGLWTLSLRRLLPTNHRLVAGVRRVPLAT